MKNDYNIFYKFAIIRVKMFKHTNENCVCIIQMKIVSV